MQEQQEQNNQLNIEISEEIAEGQYANLVIITHSHAEFVVDFVNVMPGTPKKQGEKQGNPHAPACQAFHEGTNGEHQPI